MSPTPVIVLYDDAGVVTTPFRQLPEGIESTSLMFSILRLSDEEKNHRRQATNFAIKWMLLAVGVALIAELAYYFAVLSYRPAVSNWELPLEVSVSFS